MDYPVYIEGQPAGTLRETEEGLYTVLRADCEPRDGLIRLWAHGGGRSACLGLLAPQDGRLTLTRRLSRLARAAFPSPIELISDRERDELPAPEGEAAASVTMPAPDCAESGTAEAGDAETPSAEEEASAGEEDAPPGARAREPSASDAPPAPEQSPPPGLAADAAPVRNWAALPDGSLLASDGTRAIPAALPAASPLSPHLRRIGGREYLVFRL